MPLTLITTSGAPPVFCRYLDGALLVLAKPAGLLCVPGRGPQKRDSLSLRAQAHWPGALVVHRLDQATSGLVLLARHGAAQRRLNQAFASQQVDKRYLAQVAGCPTAMTTPLSTENDSDHSLKGGWSRIDLPLMPDWPRRPLQKVDWQHGKPSTTLWRSLGYDRARDCSLLELRPLTGRTHQLRLHLAAIGHPILGDTLYADPATQARAPRLLLHAWQLGCAHPEQGHAMHWCLPAHWGEGPAGQGSKPALPS